MALITVTRHKICATFLLVSILELLVACASADFNETDCAEINNGTRCLCEIQPTRRFDYIQKQKEFKIQCFAITLNIHSQFQLKIDDGKLKIACDVNDVNIFEYLPSLNIGEIYFLEILNCAELESKYFADIFTRWNMQINGFAELSRFRSSISNQLSGLPNLRLLSLLNSNLSSVPEDLLHDINLLILRGNVIDELDSNTFASWEELIVLDLQYNNIKYLPSGVLRNQKKLKYLNLGSNNLQNSSKDYFEGAVPIEYLNLENNSIQNTPSDTFSTLPSLKNLYIGSNNLSVLHLDLFVHNEKLKTLDLNRNKIKFLPPGIVRKQKELTSLNLENNQVQNLTIGCFEGADAIKYLNLRNNSIQSIPANTFSTLSQLEELYLDSNNFSTLLDGLLRNNKNLKIFSLRQTRKTLETVPSLFFSNLTYLENVTLSCGLTSLPEDIFRGSYNLTYINLSKNNLLTFNVWILSDMLQLQTLDLSYCSLQQLPDFSLLKSFNLSTPLLNTVILPYNNINGTLNFLQQNSKRRRKLNRIHMLDMSHNKIKSLNADQLENLAEFTHNVILSSNLIRKIYLLNIGVLNTDSQFRLRVDLSNNSLNCDCKLLEFQQFMQTEWSRPESNNKISFIPNALKCKEPIHLRNEYVQNVPPGELICLIDKSDEMEQKLCPGNCECWQRPYDSTLIVNCANGRWRHENELASLPLKAFNLSVTHLYIANNNLTQLPTTLRKVNVTQIHAANNRIKEIEINDLPRDLSILDLRSNNLQRLDVDVLKVLHEMSSLQEVSLSKNQWICDCEAKLLLQFTKDNAKKIKDFDKLYCAFSTIQQKFIEISSNDICPTIPLYAYICIGFAIIGVLIAMTSVLYIKYGKRSKVWLYSHNLFRKVVSEAELDEDKIYDAFVSYAHSDEKFIADYLVPELEHGPNKFKLCIHVRDWIIGLLIADNIKQSIAASRRIIIVMSKNFKNSAWSRLEFRSAHEASLKDKRPRIIIILYDDIGDINQLDDELVDYLRNHVYFEWGDLLFWEKLRYAMLNPLTKFTRNNNDIELGLVDNNKFRHVI